MVHYRHVQKYLVQQNIWCLQLVSRMYTSTRNMPVLQQRPFVQASLCHSPVGWTILPNPFLFKKGKNRISFRQSLFSQLTLKIRLKSSLSTLKKWQLSSRRTMEAARGASFTRANLPKSSPSCRVQTTPWGEQDIQIKWIKHPPSSPLPPKTHCVYKWAASSII